VPYQTSLDNFLLYCEVALIINGVSILAMYEIARNYCEEVVGGKLKDVKSLHCSSQTGYNMLFFRIWALGWIAYVACRYLRVLYRIFVVQPRRYGHKLTSKLTSGVKRSKLLQKECVGLTLPTYTMVTGGRQGSLAASITRRISQAYEEIENEPKGRVKVSLLKLTRSTRTSPRGV
jgi:hypothetical protein